MKYVKIIPAPDTPRTHGGRVTVIEAGLPHDGMPARWFLHEGETEYIPAWATEELMARGHQVVEAVEIIDGVQTTIDVSAVMPIDIEAELANAPANEADTFLRFHGHHEHLTAQTMIEDGHTERMRALALKIHRAVGHLRRKLPDKENDGGGR